MASKNQYVGDNPASLSFLVCLRSCINVTFAAECVACHKLVGNANYMKTHYRYCSTAASPVNPAPEIKDVTTLLVNGWGHHDSEAGIGFELTKATDALKSKKRKADTQCEK